MIPAVPQTNLPPALVVGALYDSFLQAALRQFFSRATFETEPMLSASSDGRLAIEPTDDPSVMYVRWFGTRYGLRVPPTAAVHPARDQAGAIDRVGAGRAVPRDPQSQGDGRARRAVPRRDRGSLRRRRSRTARPYPLGAGETRADRIASAIEVLRVAALSSYENRAISTGVLILGGDMDPRRSTKRRAGRQARLFAGAHRREGVLPAGRRPTHAVPRRPRRQAPRHRRREAVGRRRLRRLGGAAGARAGHATRRTRARRSPAITSASC